MFTLKIQGTTGKAGIMGQMASCLGVPACGGNEQWRAAPALLGRSIGRHVEQGTAAAIAQQSAQAVHVAMAAAQP